jgi:hypothetical protein
MARIDFTGMDATDFEEFCFELLHELGFVNIDWRKGTPLPSSPADSGRDIVAQWERTDPDGSMHFETWFVEAKHHKRAVPPKELASLIAWAHAERPHVALVIASGALSNPAKDWIGDYVVNNRPPFAISYWERPILDRLTRGKRELLDRYLVGGMRSQGEVLAAESEFFDRVWYDRHLLTIALHEDGSRPLDPAILKVAKEAAERVRASRADLSPVKDDFEWGMWSGKLSALRWVLGDDWDNLDT